MPPKASIPLHNLATQARMGVLIVDLSRYEQYSKHAVQEPHRDDHFTIVVLRSGSIKLTVDFDTVNIAKPMFFLISPERIHQLKQMDNAKGWLINIDNTALTDDLRIDTHNHLYQPLLLDPASPITTHIFALLKTGADLSSSATGAFIEKAIQTTIQSVMSLALSLADSNVPGIHNSGRAPSIYRQFKTLLEQHFKGWKQTSDYAAYMAISASHLNDTIKAVSGASASVHIQERNILEAKRLLYNTNLTASEIGFSLGYEDPVYFGKLFKKHTQLTPRSFRSKFRE